MMDQRHTAIVLDSEELFGAGLKCLLAKDRSRLRAYYAGSFELAGRILAVDPQVRLAMIDVEAAGMRGAASIDQIRADYPEVRIILTAVRASRADILACLAWGVHGVVLKTQSAREIASAIRVVMAGGVFVPTVLCESPAQRSGAAAQSCDVLPFRIDAGADAEGRPLEVPEAAETLGGTHLSARQAAVFRLLVRGLSNKAIARELGLAEGTVKVHLAALYRALRVRNRASAVASLTDDTMRRLWQAAASPTIAAGVLVN